MYYVGGITGDVKEGAGYEVRDAGKKRPHDCTTARQNNGMGRGAWPVGKGSEETGRRGERKDRISMY
jgi:hypothetical protein